MTQERKLEGFTFWEKTLGRAELVVAPMVDQSELAWRLLSRRYGAQLCYTPMLHASVFIRDERYRRDALTTCEEDRPLIVQFCANDPEIFLKAAKLAEDHCDAIDLNLGCPQSIAKRGHYGAFLQDEWPLLQKMVSLCHAELKVPITCKIRVFEDIDKTVRFAKMLEAAGCQLLTVHGRTKEQKGPMTGLASWKHIKAIKDNLSIPVYANGNIQYLPDVYRCMEQTGTQGIMSAEGNLYNPGLFRGEQPPVVQVAEEYLDIVEQYPCPLNYVRAHLFKLFNHSLQVHIEVRDVLGKAKSLSEVRHAVKVLKDKIQKDQELYEKNGGNIKSELPFPYWICQPYVRPGPAETEEQREQRKEKRESVKRPLEVVNGLNGEETLSKNKMKKLLRNPEKNFNPKDKVVYQKCQTCGNPKGNKCHYSLCKACCKKRTAQESLDCPGHRLWSKSNKDKSGNSKEKHVNQAEGCETPDTTKEEATMRAQHTGTSFQELDAPCDEIKNTVECDKYPVESTNDITAVT